MYHLADALKIKYGLGSDPTDSQIKQWAEVTQKYIDSMFSYEKAGRMAASEIFYDFGKFIHSAVGDTLYTILKEAKKKLYE